MAKKRTASAPAKVGKRDEIATLSIDVGGTGLKASVLNQAGEMLADRVRIDTPTGASPDEIVQALVDLVRPLPSFDRVSVGFPGVVRGGVVRTAPNLGNDAWAGFALGKALTDKLRKPVRVCNDADVQGSAVVSGYGVEVVITLGTGFGSAVFSNGRLAPHMEIAHHPFDDGQTYDQQLGDRGRRKAGSKKWQKRVKKAIANLRVLFNFDHLYIGGGNAKRLEFELPKDVNVIDNSAGITGGIALWRHEE